MIADPFKAIADPTRRNILELLRIQGELRAGDIAAEFPDMTRIAISKHLKILNEAQLIQAITAEDGRARIFTLKADGMDQVKSWLAEYDTFWQSKLKDLKAIVKNKKTGDNS